MEALQAQGIRIAMGDFGTGYASFPHLLKYPFDKIKLDRSLLLDANDQKAETSMSWSQSWATLLIAKWWLKGLRHKRSMTL